MLAVRMRFASARQLRRRVVDPREREHQPLELGHVERGRGALARDVGHEDPHARLGERQEVVVVAPHLGRGEAEGGDPHPRRGGEALDGQQAHLDLPRDAQLLLEPLLLRLLLHELPDPARHQVEGLGQLPELVARADPDLVREVALPQLLRPHREGVDPPGDRPREEEAEDEGHRVHHHEDEAQEAEGVDQVRRARSARWCRGAPGWARGAARGSGARTGRRGAGPRRRSSPRSPSSSSPAGLRRRRRSRVSP